MEVSIDIMHLLVMGADNALGRAVAEHFATEHDVCRATWAGENEESHSAAGGSSTRVDHSNRRDVEKLVDGVDAILYLVECGSKHGDESEEWAIKRATLAPYRLLQAARQAGVTRVVLGSTLGLFDAYPEAYLIDEQWAPRPQPEASALSPYLCEQTCREFAHEGTMAVIALRFDPSEIEQDIEIALSAIGKALLLRATVPGYSWQVFHIAESDRYLTRQARLRLGWTGRDREGG